MGEIHSPVYVVRLWRNQYVHFQFNIRFGGTGLICTKLSMPDNFCNRRFGDRQIDKFPIYALTLCKEYTKILHHVQDHNFLTLSKRSTTMQVNPKVASHGLTSAIWLHTLFTVSRKPFALNLSPSKPFNWEQAIITDVADVKPTVTGTEIKSTNTPVERQERKSC